MPNTDRNRTSGRQVSLAGRLMVWSGRGIAALVIGLSLIVAVFGLLEAAPYLAQQVFRSTTLDMWAVLMGLKLLFSLAAVIGIGVALSRRRLLPALLVSALAWPMGFVIEGGRCDTEALCRMYGWAAPPAGLSNWSVRIRPVTDGREAEYIAEAALSQAGSEDHAFEPKRFRDHWLVPTINDDGWARANAVRVDVRTAATRFVPCPADKMRCGMERPVVTDGQRVFRSARLGLSAVFPAGLSVCSSWTDEQYDPLGFHAMHRSADVPCETLDQARTFGLAVVDVPVLPDCRPLSEAVVRAFGGRKPGFPGHRSEACQETSGDQIAIVVRAKTHPSLAGSRRETTTYEAYLLTTPTHFAQDARTFDAFLRTARIGDAAI
ncbi:MAG: hypothetical protein EON92_13925 [Burkholderiales bacterium]|nr:MAG: hypothetical protein EON92_13925 [Burkholderiales bacterium]